MTKMFFYDICLKIYFYPFLSYLANIKGFCPGIPTFQPTPPTTFPTFPTFSTFPTATTTLQTCPPDPLVCLMGGVRPIPNCPCIDPRLNQPQPLQQWPQQQGVPLPLPTQPIGLDTMVFVPLNPNMRRRRRRRRRDNNPEIAQICSDARSRRPGRCITLASCPILIQDLYKPSQSSNAGAYFQALLSASICGFDGSNYLVCCPLSQPFIPTEFTQRTQQLTTPQTSFGPFLQTEATFHFASLGTPTKSGNIPQPQNVFQYPSQTHATANPFVTSAPTVTQIGASVEQSTVRVEVQSQEQSVGVNISSSSCGMSLGTTNRVVGGMEASRGIYPWIAALGFLDEFNQKNLQFMCGGSLITNRFVVTSAHCITPLLQLVRLGAHDLAKTSDKEVVDFRIKRTIVHEEFDLKSIVNDIALIELSSAAPDTEFIGTICLPERNDFLTSDFVGMNPFVAGWGAVNHQGPTSNVLRNAQVPIVSRSSCELNYKSVFKFVEFSDKLVCAGSSNVDACQGDSGGPLMLPQLEGEFYKYYLLGIVSFGYECARPGFPGVYTRIASYIPWIKKQIT